MNSELMKTIYATKISYYNTLPSMGEIILEPKLLSFLVAAFIFLPFFRFISLSHDLYYTSFSLCPILQILQYAQLILFNFPLPAVSFPSRRNLLTPRLLPSPNTVPLNLTIVDRNLGYRTKQTSLLISFILSLARRLSYPLNQFGSYRGYPFQATQTISYIHFSTFLTSKALLKPFVVKYQEGMFSCTIRQLTSKTIPVLQENIPLGTCGFEHYASDWISFYKYTYLHVSRFKRHDIASTSFHSMSERGRQIYQPRA